MPGDRLGPYRIIRQLGRGGQATVYLAEDTRLPRQVALKVVDPGFAADSTAFVRFQREAEITSKLDDPGICPVYETGENEGSRWIAMRYVEGESLAAKISSAKELASTTVVTIGEGARHERSATTTSASESPSGPRTWTEITRLLAFFEQAARTLHAAHEAGVIHRDIKPGNIIVTKAGDPVILDFGLAQEVDGEHATLTLTGALMGTPAYMSPEQIAAQRIRLDRRTDVYSLGVALYECLTLQRPFDAPTRDGLYQAILTKEPTRLRNLNPGIPTDLDVVVSTAIEKDRDRRYHTALDFAEELRRVRMHEPIVAKPVGAILRLRRWSQRNPGLAVATFALFITLAAGLATSLSLLRSRNDALTRALSAVTDRAAALAEAVTERNAKDAAFRRAEGLRLLGHSTSALQSDTALALLLGLEANEYMPGVQTNNALLAALDDLRGGGTFLEDPEPAEHAAISMDGVRILTVTGNLVRTYDAATGKRLASWPSPSLYTRDVRFADPEGRTIQARGRDKVARLWKTETGQALRTVALGSDERRSRVTFNSDGTRLMIEQSAHGGSANFVRLRDCVTGAVLASLEPPKSEDGSSVFPRSSFSPDGLLLACPTTSATHVLDARTGAERARVPIGHPPGERTAPGFTPDSRWIFAVRNGGFILWDLANSSEGPTLGVKGAVLFRPTFSLDGNRLAAACSDGTLRVWNTRDWQELRSIRESMTVGSLSLSLDGKRLLVVGENGGSRVVDVADGRELTAIRCPSLGHSVLGDTGHAFAIDGIDPFGHGALVRRWDVTSREEFPATRFGATELVRLSQDRRYAFTCSEDSVGRIWDTSRERMVANLEGAAAAPTDAAFSPNGKLIAATAGKQVYLWDAGSGSLLATLEGHVSVTRTVAFIDDSRLVTGADDGTVRLWDLSAKQQVSKLELTAPVAKVTLSPDGRFVGGAGADGSVSVWQIASGERRLVLPPVERGAGPFATRWLRFTPGGRRLIVDTPGAPNFQRTSEVWDVSSWNRMPIRGLSVAGARFLDDRLLISDDDGVLELWSPDAVVRVLRLEKTNGPADVSPSGRFIVAGIPRSESGKSNEARIRVWEAPTGTVVTTFSVPSSLSGILVIEGDGHVVTKHFGDEHVWDLSTGAEVETIPDANGMMQFQGSIAGDGAHLIVASAQKVRRYPLDPVAEARRLSPRAFDLHEIDRLEVGTRDGVARARAILERARFIPEIIRELEADQSLSPSIREAAIAEARRLLEGPSRWNDIAWKIAQDRDASGQPVRDALRLAEAACREAPTASRLNTLAMTRYRSADYRGALETLRRSDAMAAAEQEQVSEFNLALLAMVQHRLGFPDEAAKMLDDLRARIATDKRTDSDLKDLITEATALVKAGAGAETKPR